MIAAIRHPDGATDFVRTEELKGWVICPNRARWPAAPQIRLGEYVVTVSRSTWVTVYETFHRFAPITFHVIAKAAEAGAEALRVTRKPLVRDG